MRQDFGVTDSSHTNVFHNTGPRFTRPGIGFCPFLLDKRTRGEQREQAIDEADAPVPVWRLPQDGAQSHEDHEINLITAGACRYLLHTSNISRREAPPIIVGAGQMLLIPGGVEHLVEVDEFAQVRGLWVHPELLLTLPTHRFDATLFALSQHQEPLPTRVLRDPQVFSLFDDLFGRAQVELLSPAPWRDDALRALGLMCALTLARALSAPPERPFDHPAQERVAGVRAWMERHAIENPPIERLARMAGMSASHFNELFAQQNGTSPKAFLIERRLRHAATLLETTSLPVAQIAFISGYEHPVNFNHAFKKRFGATPGEHRRKHQESP